MFSWKDLKDKTLSEESKGSSSVHSVSAKKGLCPPLQLPPFLSSFQEMIPLPRGSLVVACEERKQTMWQAMAFSLSHVCMCTSFPYYYF